VPDRACSHGVDLQYEEGAAGNNLLTLSEHQERNELRANGRCGTPRV